MEFVDRAAETAAIEAALSEKRPSLLRLYGRRRLGKTELLRLVAKRRDGIYLLVDDADRAQVLDSLSRQLARETEGLAIPFRDWDAFFEHVGTLDRFVILDEFQRLVENDPQAITRLQHHWDGALRRTGPSLVLCGSSVGMMQRLTGGRRGPLFGRLTGDIRLRPFAYGAVRLLYPELDEVERIQRYAVFGATPFYHQFSRGAGLEAAVRRAFLEEIAPLQEEPQTLLEFELRKPTRYNSVLYEIGNGTHARKELETKVGVPPGGLGPYLELLRDELDLVRMDDPVCGTRKQARYVFSDPFFEFYYRFVFPNRPRLELGRVDSVWKDIEEQLDGFVGRVFEDVVRQTLALANGTSLGAIKVDFEEVGHWWNRTGEELDVVARGKKEILAGEVKWSKSPVGVSVLYDLQRKIDLIERTNGLPVRPFLAARGGLEPAAAKLAAELQALVLTLDDVERFHEERFPTQP